MADLTIIQKIAIWALPLIFAITLHEVAHGYMASLFGDKTAKLSGRFSLNPLRHIDFLGTIIVPFLMLTMTSFVFGWAKPVPVDGRNMRHPRRDLAFVALAGPLVNLVMALMWGAIAKYGTVMHQQGNGWLSVPLIYMGGAGVMINVVLGVLNLIPLPPLDGSRVLSGLLPARMANTFNMIEPYGFFILILLMLTGVLSSVVAPFVFLIVNAIGDLYGL